MKKKNIVNIVNFIRGVEPRSSVDLLRPVEEQLKLLQTYGFHGSFLLQYDALLRKDMTDLLKGPLGQGQELGVWLEIVEPLCEAAGIPWRGRYAWDWKADVGFSVGYTPQQREKLVDCLFEGFRSVFGYYPRVMASWIIDAHTLAYAAERYGLDASANCKDQWGTDGYTLWGAYYNGGYYPSRNNVFCPGQSRENTLPVPVFRMLGSDPIHQYDMGLSQDGPSSCQGVITLEPVYRTAGGGSPAWVDWFFSQIFSGNCLSYAYTQVGQENSFGWEAMKDGLTDQVEKLALLSARGKVQVEPLGETGRKFQKEYPTTPATSVVCEKDWRFPGGRGKRSYWYNCRRYRVNFLSDGEGFRLRDLTLFDENYNERYQEEPCRTPYLQFDNLPVVDGNRFSGGGVLAGGFFRMDGRPLIPHRIRYTESDDNTSFQLEVGASQGSLTVYVTPSGIRIRGSVPFSLELRQDASKETPAMALQERRLALTWRGFSYRIDLWGKPVLLPSGLRIDSLREEIALQF